MTAFILDSLLYASTDHELFAHYSISRVRKGAWYMAGTEEIFVAQIKEGTLLGTKELEINMEYMNIKFFHKYWSSAEDKDISEILYDEELLVKEKERGGAWSNASFETALRIEWNQECVSLKN